mgnify:CR=1 FL=1
MAEGKTLGFVPKQEQDKLAIQRNATNRIDKLAEKGELEFLANHRVRVRSL